MTWLDFINLSSSFGGVLGGWLISWCFYKKSQKDGLKLMLASKKESLSKDIKFAYNSKKKNERKQALQHISYIGVQSQRYLLGTELVQNLEDILFKNLDNVSEVLVDINNAFKKHCGI